MKKQIDSSRMIKSMVSSMVEHNMEEWPPNCPFLTYQPVRPQHLLEENRCKNKSTAIHKR